ncbi:DNA polymerase III subunit gamma and tau [Marmoricola sp. URHB0036]|uniref:DNA polymerase III subunit gamma and tau n=1 Tax=Marmoricola sp. URHB0036 TaxID=1298863 RepID=UPI0004812141|nr:DNA polymerase III subunit gamma and tau [Marmoricola sp. URHB0036]
MEPSLALYRRYRPETFAEVIGQDHVTEPLRAALANNRVNHAYLFSGPRGCGKTTSARILARALNCEKAPIADPCGECQSCRDLARGGPGSIDVIEIDAASHGGVDDARDLRERAFFAPVASRYKVYIIDEAHMVSTQGFNALLKLVEEPPEHLRFIFATTEPEKVIATIRSRTHHYPFRLIPPRTLSDYLAQICDQEGVKIDPAALPLVVRAGAGSARDSLSVLDQLLGGAGPDGVTYDVATNLLGYTPDNLLDEVVDSFAAGDGAGVFGVVDKVIETGQDPRRFTEDVLRRLRDLVIVAAVPDAPASGLIDAPEDQAERLVAQAARFGKAELVRAADLVAEGLTEMRGATTPRLLLELICARVLLPAVDHDALGLTARMDRLERRLAVAPAAADRVVEQRAERVVSRDHTPQPATPAPAVAAETPVVAEDAPVETQQPPAAPTPEPEPAPATSGSGAQLSLADVRRIWPDLLEAVKKMRRFTWILLSQNAQVIGVDATSLTVGFKTAGARDSFIGGGSEEILRQAAIDMIGADWKIETAVDPSAQPGSESAPRVKQSATRSEPPPSVPPPSEPPAWASDDGPAEREPAKPESIAAARSNIAPTRNGDEPAPAPSGPDPDADAHRDDPAADDNGLDSTELLQRELGATVIEEIPHD